MSRAESSLSEEKASSRSGCSTTGDRSDCRWEDGQLWRRQRSLKGWSDQPDGLIFDVKLLTSAKDWVTCRKEPRKTWNAPHRAVNTAGGSPTGPERLVCSGASAAVWIMPSAVGGWNLGFGRFPLCLGIDHRACGRNPARPVCQFPCLRGRPTQAG